MVETSDSSAVLVKTLLLWDRHGRIKRTSDPSPRQLADRAGRDDIPSTNFHGDSQLRGVFQLTYTMSDDDERELESELARLQQEHRDLDAAIDALHQSPAPDLLRLQRLKKRKLQLRDRIAFIEDQITPDIIA
jgi:hypothetical protein